MVFVMYLNFLYFSLSLSLSLSIFCSVQGQGGPAPVHTGFQRALGREDLVFPSLRTLCLCFALCRPTTASETHFGKYIPMKSVLLMSVMFLTPYGGGWLDFVVWYGIQNQLFNALQWGNGGQEQPVLSAESIWVTWWVLQLHFCMWVRGEQVQAGEAVFKKITMRIIWPATHVAQ